VLERFRFGLAPRTGEVGVFVGPGWVGGEVTFRRSDLVDPPCHKLSQAHKGVGGECGAVFVVRGCWVFFGPVLEKHVPSSGP